MKQRQGYIIMMLCAGLLLTLCNCSDDSSDSMPQRTQELRLSLGYPSFRSADGVTRTTLPTNFELYNYGSSLQPISQIQCYMTYEKDGQKSIPCQFDLVATGSDPAHVWTSKVPLYTLDTGKSYYLYGFMPKGDIFVSKENVSSGANIAPYNSSYAEGAVMTFTSLNTVIAADLCVIVGVQGFGIDPTSVSDMSSRLGKFNYNPDTEGNSIFLLADHLYAGLKFNMKLNAGYAALRDIRVKKMELIPENGDNNVIETVDVVVTIKANKKSDEPPLPNPLSVEFRNPKSGMSPVSAVLYEGEKSLSTTYQEFMACICPATNTNKKFALMTTYDVYDRKNNKIRENERAQNAISLDYSSLEAGKFHVVNIEVNPTYLYVLSEPDLDNPTFQLEE